MVELDCCLPPSRLDHETCFKGTWRPQTVVLVAWQLGYGMIFAGLEHELLAHWLLNHNLEEIKTIQP